MTAFKKILVNVIFVIHLSWAILMLFGTVFIFFAHWYIPWHLGIVTGTLLLGLLLGYCPLTRWEEKLRKSFDPNFTYNNSFVAGMLKKVGIKISPKDVVWLTALLKAFAYGVTIALLVTKTI